ncbi:uncharacterized protein LOC135334553 [Halichondria panicea]|uniref:uncharacterized protein LOC135334553 n=1 Tax=Halichondria panicea TaxID=6063 RepID=UPI00312BB260
MTMYKQLLLLVAAVVLTATDGGFANETENWKEVTVRCQEVEFVEFLLENIKNETRVVLADCGKKNFVVSSNFSISSIDKLCICGRQLSLSRIHCTNNTAIIFTDVTNLHLENVHIQNCGWNETHNGGLKITNCTNVTLSGVTIENSWRTGLIMINVRGNVLIEYSNFLNNGRHQSNLTQQLMNSTYNDFHERGGGMQVMIGDGQANGFFTMRECYFSNNFASHGGGLFLVIHEAATQNNITIEKTFFQNNHCYYGGGGGGVQIGYVQEDENNDTITNNSVFFKECDFSQNTARYGGGTAVFSTFGLLEFSQNILTFSSCNWTNNSAILGLAMDISVAPWQTLSSRRHLPSPVFINCIFHGNANTSTEKSPFILNTPRGILVVTKFRLKFRHLTVFCQNIGSAIEATSATLDFQPNSNVHFIENKGLQGAAMNLKASTDVIIRENSFLLFKNNTATYSGGAIYVEYSDKHSFFTSKRCFLRYVGGEEPKNVTLRFENNFAAVDSMRPHSQLNEENIRHHGDSIFATSIVPCFEKCIQSLQTDVSLPITDTLKCIGQFSFDELDTKRRQISTSPHHFAATETSFEYDNMCLVYVNITNNSIKRNPNYQPKRYNPFEGPLHIIPGKSTKIPLRLVDDLCAEVFFVVQVRVVSSEMKSLIIHAAHSVLTDNSLTLYGEENDTGHIQLTTFGVRAISVTIKVTMDQCPPGYIHDNYDGLRACRCLSNINRMNYRGIERCNESEFRAYVKHGYWVGYVKNRSESSLASALCPKGFCINNTNTTPPTEHLLPANRNEDISLYICNANRTGRICGSCKEYHSAYYHSTSFYCGSNDLCHLGWLFYTLSEIIPVTILFLVVIVFNISFTSGPLNGVIFFIQMIDALKIKAENFIWFDPSLHNITYLYKSIFRMFTLNFFSYHQDLSFCLIRDASAMDMLAFKYFTIIYSLLLVLGTVFLLKICNFKLHGKSLPSLKGSIIHGLSGFLVMSYSECTRVSLMILTKSYVNVIGSDKYDVVPFYNGDYSYMGLEHLKYAIPAIIFLQTLVAIPPLLLLTYPLCYKLFALLRIEESKCVQITCKIIPLEKTKPLFDSIQGAFKDRYRFFAGLYFLYRLCVLLSFTLSNTLTTHYTVTGALLVSMLTLHATFCPYKKRWHNILDAILFCNLIIINTITHYNYSLLFLKFDSTTLVTVMISLQCVLIFLPLVYLIAFTIYSIVVKTKPLCTLRCHSFAQRNTEDDSDIILNNLDERENSTEGSDYTAMTIH